MQKFNHYLFLIKERLHLLIFIFSWFPILIVLLNILQFDMITGFQIVVNLSTIYLILFIPSYPIAFLIWNKTNYKILEKLSLTIVLNVSYFVLIGYIGYYAGFSMTSIYFFSTTVISFVFLILIVILLEFKNKDYIFLAFLKRTSIVRENHKNFSLWQYLKEKISVNTIFLTIFIILLCFLYVEKYSYFFGTDGWGHIYITKMITEINILPLKEYFGAVGIHIFSAVIHFFSGIELVYIPRYFVFYTFIISSLIFYNCLMRIFRNRNLAIFGVYILEFFSLGFVHMMIQFWPTSITIIMCLEIFLILYVRLEDFIKLERPSRDLIFRDIISSYTTIILIFLGAVLTHTLISVIIILSLMLTYLIFFIRDFNRGFDFILLLTLMGIFLILYSSGVISEFFIFFNIPNIPWYYFIFGGFFGGICVVIILWKAKNTIHFTPGRFEAIIKGKKYKSFKNFEDKLLFPISLIVVILFTVFYTIVLIFVLDSYPSKSLLGIETIILCIFSIWGLIVFQKTPKGKFIFLWLLSMGVLFLGAAIVNISFSGRLIILLTPIIAIGFVAYTYKIIKINQVNTIRFKIFIITFVLFFIGSFFYDDLADHDLNEYDLKKREVSSIIWFSYYNSEKSVINSEFGRSYVFIYYGYPYSEKNESLLGHHIHYFIYANHDFFHPANHINESGVNLLQQLKNEYNADFYLIIDDVFLDVIEGGLERLNKSELDQYYHLSYLNKILSVKSEYGEEIPYYWVI